MNKVLKKIFLGIGMLIIMFIMKICSTVERGIEKEKNKEAYLNGEFDPEYKKMSDVDKGFYKLANEINRKCPINNGASLTLIHVSYDPSPLSTINYTLKFDSAIASSYKKAPLKLNMIKTLKVDKSTLEFRKNRITIHYCYLSSNGDTIQNFIIKPKEYIE